MNKRAEPIALIVEDNEQSLSIRRSLLETTGFKVVSARSKEEALAQLRHKPVVDLVIIDINLDPLNPDDKSGLELAQQLRDFSIELPIIGYSAMFSDGEVNEDQLLVFQQYLAKGSSQPDDLLAHINAGRQLAIQYRESIMPLKAELDRLKLKYGISENDLKILDNLVSQWKTSNKHNEPTDEAQTIRPTDTESQSQFSDASILLYVPPEILSPPLTGEDLSAYLTLLSKVRNAQDTATKGLILEELVPFLFDKTLCFETQGSFRSATGQVDNLILRKGLTGTFIDTWSRTILIECKNWEQKINSHTISVTAAKTKKTGSDIAIIFSRHGLTGNPGFDGLGEVRNIFTAERISILVLDDTDLDMLGNGGCLITLLRDKWLAVKRLS